jgi:hypothetical protein
MQKFNFFFLSYVAKPHKMLASLKTLSVGTKTYGLLTLKTSQAVESLDEARAIAGPMNIDINFDVSGSMMCNMDTLRKTLGALIDMGIGSTLSVGVFDHEFSRLLTPTLITKENHQMLKSSIILRNRQGYTNLQDTLASMLQTPGIKILVTDGLANKPDMGLLTSDGLSKFARTFPLYSQCTIHTLGIDGSELNSDLLKTLALDSGGIFKLTSKHEGIPAFLGDVIAAHLYTRLTHMNIMLNSSQLSSILLTSVPMQGPNLRSDIPTHLVWEMLVRQDAYDLRVTSWNEATKSHVDLNLHLPVQDVEGQDITLILGCAILAPILNGKYRNWHTDYALAQQDLVNLKNFGLPASALVIALEEYICRRNREVSQGYTAGENSQDSLGAFMFGGTVAVSSPQLIELRTNAVEQSQAQNPDAVQRTDAQSNLA